MAQLRDSLLYSEELGIDLKKNSDRELFKWFLASNLFGARISRSIAAKTYKSFERHGLLDPKKILKAGWDFLVNPVMREGGYVRYDEGTSRRILADCRMLLDDYGGSLKRLHQQSENSRALENRLRRFPGFGPMTVYIFLRELRHVWPKADPEPVPVVVEIAKASGIDLEGMDRHSLDFVRLEAGLTRQRRTG